LADAVLRSLCPVVTQQFVAKHGTHQGRGAVVLGMGSLGAGRLNATSDLDLIVIYDPGEAGESDMSDGKRPLATRPYYARLTQALITAISAPMAQGRLYEVDMRLRPSGSQGPVATSLASFTAYQRDQAWTWEHLALTRARPVAGGQDLMDEIEVVRREVLVPPRDTGQVLQDVANMRARIAAAKAPTNMWDAKIGAGRMQDIELVAQTGALLAGLGARDVAAGLQGGVAAGWLSVADAAELGRCYDLCWSVQSAMRLMSGKTIETGQMGKGGLAFLCRATLCEDIDGLETALEVVYRRAAAIITAALPQEVARDG
jgi:[glutamine synthetase] adenylyltransferase / [glutamine synthetase]-adenylyl-L-tyrosine phosphorylase